MRAAVVGRLKQPPVIEGRSVHTREQDPIEARTAPGGAGTAISLAMSPTESEQAYGSLRRGGALVFDRAGTG